MQWHTQAVNVNTNLKVKVDITLPALSATNVVRRKCHVDGSSKVRNDMILGRYLSTELGLSSIVLDTSSKQMTELLKGPQHPWLIWVNIYLNIGGNKPEESFTDDYVK